MVDKNNRNKSRAYLWIIPLVVYLLYVALFAALEGFTLLDGRLQDTLRLSYEDRKPIMLVVALLPLLPLAYWFGYLFTYGKSKENEDGKERYKTVAISGVVFLVMALGLVLSYASHNFHM